MTELVVYRGLPASGKTTDARAWVAEDAATRARVNRDDLRRMLHGGYVDREVERNAVWKARDVLIDRLLRAGVSVACDDTNLPNSVVRDLAALGRRAAATPRIIDLTNVPYEECVRRDFERGYPHFDGGGYVGEDVIRGMYERYVKGHPWPLPVDLEPRPAEVVQVYAPTPGLAEAWLVDLDGTLAHMAGRSPFEWHRVGEDSVDDRIADLVRRLRRAESGADVVILSGRDEICRDATIEWLERHKVEYDALFMRPQGDGRRDSVVKAELFWSHVAPNWNVLGVLDDRDQVVEMWRSLGLLCLQVAPGAF